MLDIIAQGEADVEIVGDLIIDRTEGSIDIGAEIVREQLRCRIAAVGTIVQFADHALPQIGAKADADIAVDIEIIGADLPVERPVAAGGQADFAADIGLVADLILGAVAGGRAIRTEGRAIDRIENERNRIVADKGRRVEREAGQRRGRGEAAVRRRHRCRGRAGESVAGKIGGGAIRGQRLVDVAVQRPGGQRHRVKFVGQLDRCFEGGLVIGRTDVRIIAERMIVHILEKGGIHGSKIGQVKSRVEVD